VKAINALVRAAAVIGENTNQKAEKWDFHRKRYWDGMGKENFFFFIWQFNDVVGIWNM
jgi:hypothetical protein